MNYKVQKTIERKENFSKAMAGAKDAGIELVDLAQTYFVDGAPATAAKRLREAADKFDHFARIKDAYFRGDMEVPE